ncbi:MAG: HD domain-containing protein [Acidobacteriota bacterium]
MLETGFPHRDLMTRLFGDNAHLVGGVVRDALRGKPTTDWDLLVTGVPLDEIVERLRPHGRVDCVGRSFGVIKFTTEQGVAAPVTYDVALPRSDFLLDPMTRNHKNFRIQCDPMLPVEVDLERRDFRMNSMAVRLSDGVLIDPFDGRRDIEERLIRVTNPSRFADDPLRVIRLARFAATLEFAVDASLYELCNEVPLEGLSVERIRDEMLKMMLDARSPGTGFHEMLKLGALRALFREIYAMTLCIQDALFHPEADEYGHHTVFHHTLLVMNHAQRLCDRAGLDRGRRLVMLLAALLHDVAKPQTTAWEYRHGRLCLTSVRHDSLGADMAAQFLKRFRIFSYEGLDLQRAVCGLVRTHLRPLELWVHRHQVTKKAFARLAADVDGETDLLVLLDQADRAGRSESPVDQLDDRALWLKAQFEGYRITRETLRPMVMGRDLLEIGFEPGKAMGQVLKVLHGMQIDGLFETREEGVALAPEVAMKLFGKDRC